MIATLRGHIRRKLEDRVVLECGGIGYEVFLPPIALRQLEGAEVGEKAPELELVIYYHATRDQPRPVLIGFTSDLDKEFFERLITVKDIGPMVAARSLAAPVAELAAAIARQDEKYLRALPGIGPQKAKNIVAQPGGDAGGSAVRAAAPSAVLRGVRGAGPGRREPSGLGGGRTAARRMRRPRPALRPPRAREDDARGHPRERDVDEPRHHVGA